MELIVASDDVCQYHFPELSFTRRFCAFSTENLKCPAPGDSGSGLFLKNSNLAKPTLIGILSSGRPIFKKGALFVFTKVTRYLSWIEKTTGSVYKNDVCSDA